MPSSRSASPTSPSSEPGRAPDGPRLAHPALALAFKLALAPLLVAQAVRTRRRAPVLPEAAGSREGRAGRGEGPPVRVLVAGDSSAAGVGVAHQDQAVVGHLVRTLDGASPGADRVAALRPHRPHDPRGARAAARGTAAAGGRRGRRHRRQRRDRPGSGAPRPGASRRARRLAARPGAGPHTSSSPRCRRCTSSRSCRSRCAASSAPTRAATTRRWRAGQRRARMSRWRRSRSR